MPRKLDPATLRSLSARSSTVPLIALARDWLVVIVMFWACSQTSSPWVWVTAWLAIGWAQHAIVIIGHEGTHGLFSPSRRLNDWVTRWLCWGPLGLSADGYRRLHLAHHRLLGTADDPEHAALPDSPYRIPFHRRLPWVAAALALVGGAIREMLLFQKHASPKSLGELCQTLFIPVMSWASAWALDALWIPALWTLSTITSAFMFSRLRTFSEHLGAEEISGEHTNRSLVPGWLRWASHPHNIDHHWEHHTWPSVPFHRLPKLRRIAAGPELMPLLEIWRRAEEVRSPSFEDTLQAPESNRASRQTLTSAAS